MKAALVLATALALGLTLQAQRSDSPQARDTVLEWKYLRTPYKAATYRPVKDPLLGDTYSVWQQQMSDLLFEWIMASYQQRGLVVREVLKNDKRWFVSENGPLHSYGINLAGFDAMFRAGELDLRCCEIGQLMDVGFNRFPGAAIPGFESPGRYFFAERAPFTTDDREAALRTEGVDPKVQPSLRAYRTYLDHFHNNGAPFSAVGVVVTNNGDWPFTPVTVKEALDLIAAQLVAYPGILQKQPGYAASVQKAVARLQPYAAEPAKLRRVNYYNAPKDDAGHSIIDPDWIINGNRTGSVAEYNLLVSTTAQTIERSKADSPLWLYLNLTPQAAVSGSLHNTDFVNGRQFMVESMLRHFNFDYAARWLASPDRLKGTPYTALP